MAALSGCGGGTPDQTAVFKNRYRSATGQLQHASRAVGAAILQAPKQTDATLATVFRGLADNWQAALSRLETLKPPTSLAADFNTLTGAGTRVTSDLNAIATAAITHDKAAGEQGAGNVVSDIAAAKLAAETLDQKLGIR
jgi:hypothetical protein